MRNKVWRGIFWLFEAGKCFVLFTTINVNLGSVFGRMDKRVEGWRSFEASEFVFEVVYGLL